jgi:hypothetical protein
MTVSPPLPSTIAKRCPFVVVMIVSWLGPMVPLGIRSFSDFSQETETGASGAVEDLQLRANGGAAAAGKSEQDREQGEKSD